MNGIPAPIITRAATLATLASQGEDLVTVCAAMSPEEEEDLAGAESTVRAFLELELGAGQHGIEDEGEDLKAALDRMLNVSITER